MTATANPWSGDREDAGEKGAERLFLEAIGAALGAPPEATNRVRFDGPDGLPSAFAVTALASATIGAAGLAISELVATVANAPSVTVDRRLAALWFGLSIRPVGWTLPSPWDPIAGDYPAADGWIRLHTNAPRHRAAALGVLGSPAERPAVAEAVSRWPSDALEQAVVEAGGSRRCDRSPNGGPLRKAAQFPPSR